MLGDSDQNQYSFENKVRVRVCGILKDTKGTLLLKHKGIGKAGYLWSPPGGGVEFGDSLINTLVREFKEETNLDIEVGEFLFTNEHIDSTHHALEFFFRVKQVSGSLLLGFDPELAASKQILTDAKFFSTEELNQLPGNALHSAFLLAKTRDKIDDLRGLITFKD